MLSVITYLIAPMPYVFFSSGGDNYYSDGGSSLCEPDPRLPFPPRGQSISPPPLAAASARLADEDSGGAPCARSGGPTSESSSQA